MKGPGAVQISPDKVVSQRARAGPAPPQPHYKVLVILFGDAAGHPLEVGIDGTTVEFHTVILAEAALLSNLVGEILEFLTGTAVGMDFVYVYFAPKATTLSGRGARHPDGHDAVGDRRVEAQLAELLPRMTGWRVIVLTTGRSSFGTGAAWNQALADGGSWSEWRASLGAFGGSTGVHARLRLRGCWPRRVSPRDWHVGHHVDSTASSTEMEISGTNPFETEGGLERDGDLWAERRLVAQRVLQCALRDDLRAELSGGPSLHSRGPVRRHAARGAPVHSPKEHRRQQDEACQAGMRDAAQLAQTWPELWEAMAPVGHVLAKARASSAELRGLSGALGKAASRAPPSEESVRTLRSAVALELGLTAGEAEDRHPASPWRHRLVAAVQDRSGDPDVVLRDWLRDGAPMGIRKDIDPGHLFPPIVVESTCLPDDVFLTKYAGNHPSFLAEADGRCPGHATISEHVAEGFGLLFRTRADLEKHLGSRVAPAPLGCVTTLKPDGAVKHRVIQDQRRSGVNAAVVLPERQVLPTVFSHASDLAVLAASAANQGSETIGVETLVLDFSNAFMNIALAAEEMPYNVCGVESPVARGRPQLYPHEPKSGHFIAWRVLGFGGSPNPLVFARAASFAARSAQALVRVDFDSALGHSGAGPARLQLYVDDPAVTVAGTPDQREMTLDIMVLWWLCLGLPLAWAKGLFTVGLHRWIGANYLIHRTKDAEETLREILGETKTYVTVEVPQDFIDKMLADLALIFENVTLNEATVDRVLGRGGRLAYLVPHVKPYVTMLWAAKSASDRHHAQQHKRVTGRRYPAQRFRHAASWIQTLLRPPPGQAWLPLEHVVTEKEIPIEIHIAPVIEFDASPWGFGAVLRREGQATSYFFGTWTEDDALVVGSPLGDPSGQTAWEYLALFLVLLTYGAAYRKTGVILLGDNLASLTLALELKGDKVLGKVSREIAWRRIRLGWRYLCGHLPGEQNSTADFLSRISVPGASSKPLPEELLQASWEKPPILESVWTNGL